jgi:hypothetical protein
MYFGFILLLALGAVVDSHVKLRRANMEVKSHEKPLMEVVILRKLRPAALEVLLAGAIVPNSTSYGATPPECSQRTASRSSRPSMNLVNFSGTR